MSKALFVTRHDISVFTAANGNIDNDKLLPFINQAQDIHIQNYLGTDLYNKIQADIVAGTLADPYLALLNDYIKDMLLHWSMVEYLPYAGVNIANGGIYTKNPENSTALTKEHVDYLIQKSESTAQFYTRRFIDYMQSGVAPSNFPEYYSNTQADMYPDDVAENQTWVL
jgi:adenine-specific DNA methylase